MSQSGKSGGPDVTTEPSAPTSLSHETTSAFSGKTGPSTPKPTNSPVVTSRGKPVSSGTFESTLSTDSSSTIHLQTTSAPTVTTETSTTTTQASLPWKGVSFGLMGGVALLLLVCILLIVAICKLKRRLKKAHVTLYPVARDTDHAYTPLAPAVKKGLAVEMSKVPSAEMIEEVDSPTFSSSPPPPTFPRPASQSQSTTSDKPPEVPARRAGKPRKSASETSMKSRENVKWQMSSDSRTSSSTTTVDNSGVDNKAFAGGVVHQGSLDEDDIYEKYDTSFYQNVKASGRGEGDISSFSTQDSVTAYEEPVTMRNKQKPRSDSDFIRRQSSTSGLPESVFHLNEINETENSNTAAKIPEYLDLDANDAVDSKDSGLPIGDGPLNLDDLQTYEDVEDTMSTTDNVRNASNGSGSDENKETEHTYRILEPDPNLSQPPPLYDTGFMGDKINSDDDSEPGLYEDLEYDINEQDMLQNDRTSEDEPETVGRGDGSQLGNAETLSCMEKANGALPDDPLNVNTGLDSTDINTKLSAKMSDDFNVTEPILVPPIVPPRKDLGQTPPSISLDMIEPPVTFEEEDNDGFIQSPLVPVGDVEMRPGRRVRDITNTIDDQNTYFLDMNDGYKEINEAYQERISVHKMGDSEMSLSALLHLYGGDKSNDHNALVDTPGMNSEEDIAEKATVDNSADNVIPNQVSNGILANGNVLDDDIDTTENIEFDENIYDIPPPRRDESIA